MEEFSIRCTLKQTKKALKLGAPISNYHNAIVSDSLPHYIVGEIGKDWNVFICPTAEQMCSWLRSKGIQFHFDDERNYWNIGDANDDLTPLRWYGYSDNKELDAIDAALEHLANKK